MPVPPQPTPRWRVTFADEHAYKKFLADFENENDDDIWISRKVDIAFETFRTPAQKPGWFLNLKMGLFELRLRRNPKVLVRLFFYIEAENVINVVWFYDKKKNASALFQQKQIKKARSLH